MTDLLLNTVIDFACRNPDEIPPAARRFALLSLYDWLLCSIAGRSEPVAQLIRAYVRSQAAAPIASMIGDEKTSASLAAMVNGTTGHALDFDDTHFAHIGHLSVAIYPAAFAVAEEVEASLDQVVDAFLLGAEAAIRIGMTLGAEHYNRGYHQTATAGAFGACVAASRLYGLNRDQIRTAVGLCATRASGLKCQFGTMGKPYNAGIAASNGVETAKLAMLGFSSAEDGLMGDQGFIPTHSNYPQPAPLQEDRYLFVDVRYKFHACCHGTHAMLEALLLAVEGRQISLDDVRSCRVRTSPRWMNVCNIQKPTTGLEVKFSYRWLAGMLLANHPTGSIAAYTDVLAKDPQLTSFAKRVEVVPDDAVGYMQSECELVLESGEQIVTRFDLEDPISPDEVERKLRRKGRSIFGDGVGPFDHILDSHASLTALDAGTILRELGR